MVLYDCFDAFYAFFYKLLGVECPAKSATPMNFCAKYLTPRNFLRVFEKGI